MNIEFEYRVKTDEKTVRSGNLISVKKGGNSKISETLPFSFAERSDARIYAKECFRNLEKGQSFEEYLKQENDLENHSAPKEEMSDEIFEKIVKKSDDKVIKALWDRLQNSEEEKTFSKEVKLPEDECEWTYEAVYKNTYVSCAILYEDFVIIFEDALIDSEPVDFEKVEPNKFRNLEDKKKNTYKKRSMWFKISGNQKLVPFKRVDSDGKEKDCYGYITIKDYVSSQKQMDDGDLEIGKELWLGKDGRFDIQCRNFHSDSVKQWIVKTVSGRDELSDEDREDITGKYYFAFTCSITVNIKNCTLFGDPERTEKIFIDNVLVTRSNKHWMNWWKVCAATGGEPWGWYLFDDLWEGPRIKVAGEDVSLGFLRESNSEYGMMVVDARELVPFYNMQIKTESGDYTGTDSDITAVLHGEYGDFGPVRLNGYVTHSNAFESGKCDGITIGTKLTDRYKRVGRIYQIDLKTNMKWAAPGWKPEYIDVCQMMFKYGLKHKFTTIWGSALEQVPSTRCAEDYVSRFLINNWIDNKKKTYTYVIDSKAWSWRHAFVFAANEEISYDPEDLAMPNCHVIPKGKNTLVSVQCGRNFEIQVEKANSTIRTYSRRITPEELLQNVRIAENDTLKLLSSTHDYTTAKGIFESLEKPDFINPNYMYFMALIAEGESLEALAESLGYAGHRGEGKINLTYDYAEKAGLETFGDTNFRTYRTTITKQHLYGAILCNDVVAMVDLGVGKGIKVELLKNDEFVEIDGVSTNWPRKVKSYNTNFYKNSLNDSIFVNLDGEPLPKDTFARAHSHPTICQDWEKYIRLITEKERSLLNKENLLRTVLQRNMLERESLLQMKKQFLKCDPNYKETEVPGRPPMEELPDNVEELQRQIVELNNINAGLLEDNARLSNELKTFKENYATCETSKVELENQVTTLLNDKESLERNNLNLTQQNLTLQSQKTALENGKQELQEKYDALEQEHQGCSNTIADLNTTIQNLRAQLASCPTDLAEAAKQIAELQAQLDSANAQIAQLQALCGGGSDDDGRLRQLEKRLADLEKQRDYAVRRIGSIQLLIMNKRARPSDKKEIEEQKAKLALLDSQIKELEAEIKSLRS